MKKLFAFLFISVFSAVLVFGASTAFAMTNSVSGGQATNEAESFDVTADSSAAESFVTSFLTEFPNRQSTADQYSAAIWLEKEFSAYCETKVIDVKDGNGEAVCYNVEARIESASSQSQVIIGAHFDSACDGANDNASGVAALYLTMQSIAGAAELPFDVVFVAFGGEESGLLGSYDYVESMSGSDRENTLVMFNLDSVGGGDNLYVFCENKSTSLANLILANQTGASALVEKPYAMGIYPIDYYGYGYYEEVQGSDHTPFRLAEVPTVLFFAGNYSGWNYVESSDSSKNVMNTSSDTLDNMEQFWGNEFYDKTATVAATLTATLTSSEFLSVAQNARNELVNNDLVFGTLWPTVAVAALLVLCVVFGCLYYRKLQKRAILGTAEAKEQPSVFQKPNVEDIFDLGDNNKK